MFPIGQIIGAVIMTYLLSLLIDWAIFKRIPLPRTAGILGSTIVAAVLGLLLYGVGRADGGDWNPGAAPVAYGIGGVIAGALRIWRFRAKARRDGEFAAE